MTPSRRAWLAPVLVLALAWPGRVAAEPKDPVARKHLETGQAAFGRDDYEAAIESYEKALAIEREPKVLYLLGQAEFLRGRCRESVGYFKQVKEFEVGGAVEDAIRRYLAECAEQLLEEPEPEPEPETTPEPEEDLAPSPPVDAAEAPVDEGPARPRRWYQDPLGDTLVAVGVVGAAAGGAMLGVAQQRQNDAPDYGALEDAAGGIRTLRIAGAATLGVGAALMIGGFVRWGVISRRSRTPSSARLGVHYDGVTAGVTLRARF